MVRDNREAETEMERRRRRRKAEKLRGLKRRRRRLVLAILAVLFLPIIGARIYFGVNPVILKNSVIDVELKDSVNLKKNIRYVFAGKASQVKITGSVDNTKEGDYRVTYSWRGRKKTVTVKVRDTKPPVLEMKNSYTVDLGGAFFAQGGQGLSVAVSGGDLLYVCHITFPPIRSGRCEAPPTPAHTARRWEPCRATRPCLPYRKRPCPWWFSSKWRWAGP